MEHKGFFSKTLKEITKRLKSYSLSNFDFLDIDPNVKITLSDDLKHTRFADELVNSQGIGILLWQFQKNLKDGHWLGIIRNGNEMEVFDPYGTDFKSINKHLFIKDGENPLTLIRLIKQSGYVPVFNSKKLQAKVSGDNSCGRWVALRLAFRNHKLPQFHSILTQISKSHHIKPLDIAVISTIDKK
jgi:hypothetical protein